MGRKKKKKLFVVRPWSIGRCPSPEEVRTAWACRRRSQKDFIWLLSVLAELTCFTDCSLEHRGGFGNIAGRKGGLKAYLAENLPELVGKYKSMSRYVRLSYRIRRAYSIYPPAALSLMHPDLPLPKRNMPFLTNHVRKIWRDHFEGALPHYASFDRIVRLRESQCTPKFVWGPPLPRDEWGEAENRWRKIVLRPKALAKIKADHSLYARDYRGGTRGLRYEPPGIYSDRAYLDEDWVRQQIAEDW